MASGIGSFFGRLFGGGGGEDGSAPEGASTVDYEGFRITPAPRRSGGQWLTAGVIRKEIAGVTREHVFVRADTFSDKDGAAAMAVEKGRRIVDEQGDRMFG